MMRIRTTLTALLLSLSGAATYAADFSDPEWPCIQRKVENLSVGLMWPGMVEPKEPTSEPLRQLAAQLSQRRTAGDVAQELIASAQSQVDGWGGEAAQEVFSGVFSRVSRQRGQIINGIKRYSLKQADLSQKIEELRQEMTKVEAAENPDFDKLDALEEQLDWEERIYRDRAKSLIYVCETPVLLEKHVYAVAQMLRAAAE